MTCALIFLLAALSTTASPDQRDAENIPDAEQKANTELPPPYEPWRGTGPLPPTATSARELPPPLARPREQPRRPIELGVAVAAFLPSCGSGSIDDHACLTLSAGSGVDAALLYRATPFFAFGAEGALSGFGNGHGALSSAGGSARFIGVVGRVYFADSGSWDPYLALTLGVGVLSLRGAADAKVATTGLGARVAGGIDYGLGSHLRLGPSASFSRWFAYSDASCEAGVCHEQGSRYGHVLGFVTLGLRLTGSFGEAL
ncbi:MAG TPA: hypothetical protein VHB79_28735 [Polyangiaceae bacterium]|nr:hypothetical protein [Polyangiaceae bacterium]